MNRSILVGACLLFVVGAKATPGQEAVLAELYGQGVHAFFAQDMRTAHDLFTNSIEQGTRDPRSYYFRGLTYSMLGRPEEAEADFKAGAALEAGNADRVYPVADSLQRVQGRMRMQIEKHRQLARLSSHAKASRIQKARYEEMKRSEQAVLRGATPPAAAVAPPAPGAAPAAAPAADAADPFASGAEMTPEKAPEKPAEATAEAAPAAADPFGAAAPAAPAAPAAEPAAPASDAATNPFADDAPAAPAAAEPAAPATPAPAANAEDPFK